MTLTISVHSLQDRCRGIFFKRSSKHMQFGLRTVFVFTLVVATSLMAWNLHSGIGYLVTVVAIPVFCGSQAKLRSSLSVGEICLGMVALTVFCSLLIWVVAINGNVKDWFLFGTESNAILISLIFSLVAGVLASPISLGLFFMATPFIDTYMEHDSGPDHPSDEPY